MLLWLIHCVIDLFDTVPNIHQGRESLVLGNLFWFGIFLHISFIPRHVLTISNDTSKREDCGMDKSNGNELVHPRHEGLCAVRKNLSPGWFPKYSGK